MTAGPRTTPAMERLAARRAAAAGQLREDLLHHLWSEFPQHCIALTDPQTRRCVEAAITAAERYGVTELRTVRVYATMMVFLGHRFDDDPLVSWASQVLGSNRGAPQAKLMARLQAMAATKIAEVVGDEGEHYRRALLWARSKSFGALVTDYASRGEEGIEAFIHDLLPTKHAALGTAGLAALQQRAQAAARRHGIAGPEGTLVVAGLMVLLGSGFADDPFHPWVAPALERARGAEVGAEVLHATALAELERYLRLDRVMRRE